MNALMGKIEELNENFNELGEDLVLLESVVRFQVDKELETERRRLAVGQEQLRAFIRDVRAVCNEELAQLDLLPDLPPEEPNVRNLSGGLSRRAVKNGKAASSLPGGDSIYNHKSRLLEKKMEIFAERIRELRIDHGLIVPRQK